MDINILSLMDCYDEAYGDYIADFTVGDGFRGFCFVYINDTPYEDQIRAHIKACGGLNEFPKPSQLSKPLLSMIKHSSFDMYFFVDDDDISDMLASDVLDEASKWGALDSVIDFEAIYAGAMCCVNWIDEEDI